MLDSHRMWLLALDTINGRSRARAMVTAVAATLLLDLVDQDLVAWDAESVRTTDLPSATPYGVLEAGRATLVKAERSGTLRPSDAIDALHPQVWNVVGDDLESEGVIRRRRQRLPWGAPRWDLQDPDTRIHVVRELRRALRAPVALDTSSHHLAAVLWATDTEEHGLSENSLFNTSATQALAPLMSTDPLADRLSKATAYLVGPFAQIGGNPTLY